MRPSAPKRKPTKSAKTPSAEPASGLDTRDPLRPPQVATPSPVHAAACRVQFAMPPVETGSWLGGLPNMPEHVDWPVSDGKGMQFFAQINLADVPRDTWGGLHPETGWLLLFFGSKGGYVTAKALYVPTLGAPRHPPKGTEPYYVPSREDHFPAFTPGGEGTVLPGWPIEIIPTDEAPKVRAGGLVTNRLRHLDLSDPRWHPFDRKSQRAFLLAACKEMEDALRILRRPPPEDEAEIDPDGHRRAALGHCEDLMDGLTAALTEDAQIPPGDDLSPALDSRVQEILDGLSYELITFARQGEEQDYYIERRKMTLLGSGIRQTQYIAALEFVARDVYLRNPAELPARIKDLFEPVWREACAAEVMTLGGVPTYYMEEYGFVGAKLLELPSSDVMGWSFGDGSNAAFSIDEADLVAGNWDRAKYCDSHGL